MKPGDLVMLDGILKVRVVRLLPENKAIIAVGSDTQIVSVENLSTSE